MIYLERQGIQIYNSNKFGGHPTLSGQQRDAFETAVKIIALKALPYDEMNNLGNHMEDIVRYIEATNGADMINNDTIKPLRTAWNKFLEHKRHHGFGKSRMPQIAFEKGYIPLRVQPINDNNAPYQSTLDFFDRAEEFVP